MLQNSQKVIVIKTKNKKEKTSADAANHLP